MSQPSVLIVGAGLAGLCCGLRLQQRGIPFRILEAADQPGGRIRTDHVDGFLLDRGFQVLLTAYPEAARVLDYEALGLRSFHSGAKVMVEGELQEVGDPLRRPASALPSAFAKVGTLQDKLRVLALRRMTSRGSVAQLLTHPEVSALERLRDTGFSETMIERFFRPFFSGIFLEPNLATSSRKFDFVFRMFSKGTAALPANGMQAIPEQLAARLPQTALDYGTVVTAVEGGRVATARGETFEAAQVILAVEYPEAMRLLGRGALANQHPAAACLYFDAPYSPIEGPWLVLNGEGNGPVNNVCVPSEVQPNYAPKGRSLVSLSVVGNPPESDELLERLALRQMERWFGNTETWRHLRTYRIPFGVPAQLPGALLPVAKPVRVAEKILLCGDYMDIASLNGAMLSGFRAAEAV